MAGRLEADRAGVVDLAPVREFVRLRIGAQALKTKHERTAQPPVALHDVGGNDGVIGFEGDAVG